jgi:hypothetical protein
MHPLNGNPQNCVLEGVGGFSQMEGVAKCSYVLLLLELCLWMCRLQIPRKTSTYHNSTQWQSQKLCFRGLGKICPDKGICKMLIRLYTLPFCYECSIHTSFIRHQFDISQKTPSLLEPILDPITSELAEQTRH